MEIAGLVNQNINGLQPTKTNLALVFGIDMKHTKLVYFVVPTN